MPALLGPDECEEWLTEEDPVKAVKVLRPAREGILKLEEALDKTVQQRLV